MTLEQIQRGIELWTAEIMPLNKRLFHRKLEIFAERLDRSEAENNSVRSASRSRSTQRYLWLQGIR